VLTNTAACADQHGRNAQLPTFWAAEPDITNRPSGCLRQDWTDKSVWCNPDFSQIDEVLARYLRCYAVSPGTTKALFILV